MKPLRELINGFPNTLLQGDLGQEIAAIEYDSRQARPQSLFICIRGGRHDGHRFIPDAARRGAVAFLVERDVRSAVGGPVPGTILQVEESRRALSHVATRFYDDASRDLSLTGITGTNGKTTVSYLAEAMLRAGGHRVGVIGTIEYRCEGVSREAEQTTPEASDLQALLRWMIEQGADAAIMEVSSHSLALHRVAGCAFNVAVFTNLTQDHLDFHGTMEAYFEAKAQLFALLREKGGTAVINLDDPAGKRLREAMREPVVTYGLTAEADVTVAAPAYDLHGVRAQLRTPWGTGELRSPLLGRHNLYNCLAALGVGGTLGVPVDRALESLATVSHIPGRLEPVECGQPFKVVVDYAHTPDALEWVLRSLRELCAGRLTVLFGCGGDRDRKKRPLMGEAAVQLADRVFLTSDNPRSESPEAILVEIEAGVRHVPGGMQRTALYVDRRQAIEAALQEGRPNDIILIAGKGHERTQTVGQKVIPFDDREVARDVLQQLGYRGERGD
ncbi:MAG: UDP-N-acetylmuramoyl-L-alanyl-D-glutamate--2,6-diaminopimelate ligase [candidate division NC10 bacterium]|nr:UDP-N-acetylmuramoyl-L-alanyl-D-glutamate--2,6-diaminopimelate ligase [candidate division NC10 bacterium]